MDEQTNESVIHHVLIIPINFPRTACGTQLMFLKLSCKTLLFRDVASKMLFILTFPKTSWGS